MARLTADARATLAVEEGAAADRDLRRFLILVIGKLILGTRGDPVSCRCLPLLEDLTQVGHYAWGAALLAHLIDSLGTSSRETGVAGFFPLLQVTLIHDALDTVPYRHVDWTPYAGEDDAAQPWVEQGCPYFVRVREQLEDWEQWGRAVTSEATSDEDYFRAYARRYGAQVYKGTRGPLDPEGRIASLKGVLHSTIQQRDDLQQTVTQLVAHRAGAGAADGGRCLHLMRRARPLRAGGPASSGGETGGGCRGRTTGAGRSEASLVRTAALEKEMVEMRLRPQTDEATGLRREVDELRS
ncbi:hypothetical protein Taro_040797 [Colocasia esculenta]|uniref:Aminotransferase-like plant mobile domain-containing protein n=1 Tax=Colocasia esculenta TaxID=4460 RepID=A0A843WZ58_COLES|nr:hypothetical protein [Colocasia esculenta]